MKSIAVAASPDQQRAARRLADELALPYAELGDTSFLALLVATPTGLELRWHGQERFKPTQVNLTAIDGISPQGRSLRQPIARAVGLVKGSAHRPVVLDATAGFGEDAWLLASLGCQVMATERSGAVAAMLADGVRRAGGIHPEIAERLVVCHGNSIELLERQVFSQKPIRRQESFDTDIEVIYLDPMFPARKKTAKERKQMRMLRRIVGPDTDSGELFKAAMKTAARRVVVKRPLHAEPLAENPVAIHKARAHRYDVYVPTGGSE